MLKSIHIFATFGRLASMIVVATVVAPSMLRAFAGPEHVDISNMALRFAVYEAARNCATDCQCLGASALSDLLAPLTTPKALEQRHTYGDLVALADRVTGVENYFDTARDVTGTALTVDAIPWRHIDSVWENRFRNAQALHLNLGHFQHNALFNHLYWHQVAVEAAARGELGSAVIFSAYADHFLQDFFAPGHVMARRLTLDDMASLNIHNYYNREGLDFIVKDSALSWINSLASGISQFSFDGVPLRDAKHRKLDPENLKKTLGRHRTLRLRGDSLLYADKRQATFLLIVVARSVMDVVESYSCQQVVNNFSGYDWHWPSLPDLILDGIDGYFGPTVGNSVGEYFIPEGLPPKAVLDHPWKWPVVLVTAGLQFFPRGENESGRAIVDMEILRRTVAVPEIVRRNGDRLPLIVPIQSPSTLLGLSYIHDDRLQGVGLSSRSIYPIPRINTQISLSGGLRYLDGDAQAVRPFAGVEAQMGFGLLFLRFGLDRDYLMRNGDLHASIAVKSGVAVVVPTSMLGKK